MDKEGGIKRNNTDKKEGKTMKYLLSILIVLFTVVFAANAYSLDINWHTADQSTVAWDQSAILKNGNPLPETDVIKWEVFIVEEGQDKDQKVSVGITEVPKKTITFTEEGKFFAGVQVLRYDAEGNLLSKTPEISWSDNSTVVQNEQIFGFDFYYYLQLPQGLRKAE